MSTIDYTTNFFGRLWVSGLGYQIEHHLFPSICHVHLHELSKMVRDFCAREGYPYRSYSWSEALVKMVQSFQVAKPVSDLQSCRLHQPEGEVDVANLAQREAPLHPSATA